MQDFYRLHIRTRKRIGIPPQPFSFFRNIQRFVIDSGHGAIMQALYEDQVIASNVYFYRGEKAIYKFGASDESTLHMRPNDFLMWESIKHFSSHGYCLLSLGRTAVHNDGLLRFKRGFGPREDTVTYTTYYLAGRKVATLDKLPQVFTTLMRFLPIPVFRLIGKFLYKHIG